jgi:hypothetical protein
VLEDIRLTDELVEALKEIAETLGHISHNVLVLAQCAYSEWEEEALEKRVLPPSKPELAV